MAFSSGTFSLVAGNPVVTGTTISSTVMNNTLSDIATGLTTCILKDGTQTCTAKIPFAGGISIPTGQTFSGAGGIDITGSIISTTTIQTSTNVSTRAATATPSGGAGVAAINMGSAGLEKSFGAGSPTGVRTAPRGSLYIRTDNGTSAALYVNSDASTTWVAVTTSAF